MTPLEFLAIALASGAVVDVWRQGSIFARPRKAVADRVAAGDPSPVLNLLDCWYCLSYWVPAMIVATVGLAHPGTRAYAMLPVYALAATRLVVIVNGLVPERMRHEYAMPVPASPEAWMSLIERQRGWAGYRLRRNGKPIAIVLDHYNGGTSTSAEICEAHDIAPEEFDACIAFGRSVGDVRD